MQVGSSHLVSWWSHLSREEAWVSRNDEEIPSKFRLLSNRMEIQYLFTLGYVSALEHWSKFHRGRQSHCSGWGSTPPLGVPRPRNGFPVSAMRFPPCHAIYRVGVADTFGGANISCGHFQSSERVLRVIGRWRRTAYGLVRATTQATGDLT